MLMTDVVLLLLVLLFAASGYRQGFVVGTMSFAGFFSGALLGLQIGPPMASLLADPGLRVLVSLATVFLAAIGGQMLAGWFATRVRYSIVNPAGQRADEIGGAVVSVLAVLLVSWLVAVPLASSSIPWLARSIQGSYVLGAVDRVMPAGAEVLSQGLRQTLNTRGFPEVFGGLDDTRAPQVAAPDPALGRAPAVERARQSVVKVLGVAGGCERRLEGSGFVYANERVMTNAHVVAGTDTVMVEAGTSTLAGRVTVYDPDRDLAVIYVPGLGAPPMRWSRETGEQGENAIVLGFPLDGPYNAQPARIRQMQQQRGPDLYLSGEVTREIYTIRALVRSGNSGGPLIDARGDVLGVIFAASARDPETGFALTAAEAAPVARTGLDAVRATGTGECAGT
ncbi:S1-C subfamily serine protease [Catenuloplanes nepalensis]|uniref:S1-C subfamily serine protease n=1 Tax=Catenuloplanes nepalensis TaxID=587533 RepID=A0ABT9MXW2_9ACTN|nr:MarP family serine protease [Catenuloplanes nepalensis]MDP9796081.1 S1-C subfamily serine protease [Catenuloplanes nepalensis]